MLCNLIRSLAVSLATISLGITMESAAMEVESTRLHCGDHHHNSTTLTFEIQLEITAATGNSVITAFVVTPDGEILTPQPFIANAPVPVSFIINVERAKAGEYVLGVRGDTSGSISDSFTATSGLALVTSSKSTTTGFIALSPDALSLPILGAATGEITVSYVYSHTLHP